MKNHDDVETFAVVNVLGATADLTIYRKGVVFRATLDLSGDFAMVTSYAYKDWREKNPEEVVQQVLREQRYYHGYGGTARLNLSAKSGPIDLRLRAQGDTVRSINGWDNDQQNLTHDLKLSDSRFLASASVGYTRGRTRFSLEGRLRLRKGEAEGTTNTDTDWQLLGRVGYTF